MYKVGPDVLDLLFREARSQNGWLDEPVNDSELEAAYELAKCGPTSMNSQPLRLVIIRSQEAKSRLKPALGPPNVEKVMTAPVVALITYDLRFFELLPRVFPHNPGAGAFFKDSEALSQATAIRNGSLQAAYFLLALRAVGLDVGPLSGFDPAAVEREFLSGTSFKINLICAIGHGDPSKVFKRSPRLDYEEVSRTL